MVYNPQINGAAKRTNKKLLKRRETVLIENQNSGNEIIRLLKYAYNMGVRTSVWRIFFKLAFMQESLIWSEVRSQERKRDHQLNSSTCTERHSNIVAAACRSLSYVAVSSKNTWDCRRERNILLGRAECWKSDTSFRVRMRWHKT